MNTITITDLAARKIAEYAAKSDAQEALLRVGVRGGGCSGFKYVLAFDVERDGDSRFDSNGVGVLVNAESLPYVKGSSVDFVDELTGAGFKVNNPNALASCGCGDSFRVDTSAPDCGPSSEDSYL